MDVTKILNEWLWHDRGLSRDMLVLSLYNLDYTDFPILQSVVYFISFQLTELNI